MRRLALLAFAAAVTLPAGSSLHAQRTRPHRYRARRPRVTYRGPTTAGDASGASARCRDGSLSYSAHRRGTCSHHGGVATWLGLR